jgi:hypothetical protein
MTALIQSHFCPHCPTSKRYKKHDVSEEQPGSEKSFLKRFKMLLVRYNDSLQTRWSGDRIPVGASFSAHVQTGPWVHPASCTMGTGSFPGVKRPGRDVDHPPSSSAEVKERVELYLYSPSAPWWPVLGWPLLYFTLLYFTLLYFTTLGTFQKRRMCQWVTLMMAFFRFWSKSRNYQRTSVHFSI